MQQLLPDDCRLFVSTGFVLLLLLHQLLQVGIKFTGFRAVLLHKWNTGDHYQPLPRQLCSWDTDGNTGFCPTDTATNFDVSWRTVIGGTSF